MLCKANCTLQDWPLDGLRDVDPKDETIIGLLRAGYIVPMMPVAKKRKPAADQTASE
jgi:hypothetical protein